MAIATALIFGICLICGFGGILLIVGTVVAIVLIRKSQKKAIIENQDKSNVDKSMRRTESEQKLRGLLDKHDMDEVTEKLDELEEIEETTELHDCSEDTEEIVEIV